MRASKRQWLDRVPRLGHAATWVSLVLVVLVAHSGAALTWQLFPARERPSLAAAAGVNSAPAADRIDIATLASWHLFGTKQLVPIAAAVPETRLNLRLAGIFHSTSAVTAPAFALIAAGDGQEKGYRVGDQLGRGVQIEQIDIDRIILSRDGQLETLKLPRGAIAAVASTPRIKQSDSPGRRIGAQQVARQLRGQARPDSLQDIAYATPFVQNGQFVGLRLKPGRQRRLLAQLGLRSGDVLTELNGTPLTDPAQSVVLMQELLSADQVQAKVIRNGAIVPFTFVLNE